MRLRAIIIVRLTSIASAAEEPKTPCSKPVHALPLRSSHLGYNIARRILWLYGRRSLFGKGRWCYGIHATAVRRSPAHLAGPVGKTDTGSSWLYYSRGAR